jgi:Bacterial CdiA-CT RNAse A domain
MDTVNVNYIPSEWERTKKDIGNLIGLGAWGKGMIDNLKDISDLLEDAQSDIAKYDSDGVISFTHTDRKSQYQSLYEDFLVMHRFSGRIGDIVDRIIDEPFYQDIDAFVEAMRDLSISEIKTKNRIGAKETIVVPGTYGTQETIEVPKAEVGLEDLFSGSNYYARLMEREYASWKELNPRQDFSKKEYIQTTLNSHAFQYESIKDGQLNKEFWGQITALAVIVGASFICPPAGMALGVAYGTLELSSTLSGKDWISGRKLGTGERVFRSALAPLDIVPGVSALSKFSSAARFAPLREAMDPKLFTSLKAGLHQKSQRACDLVVHAENSILARIRSAKAWTKEMTQHLKTGAKKGSLQVGRFVDNAATNLRHLLPSRQMGLAIEGAGNVKVPVENKIQAWLSKMDGINVGGGKAGNDGIELSTKGKGNVNPKDFSPLAPGGGLAAHEARGGHLISRHVGKTDAELLQRLKDNPKITGASTFKDRATAEKVASEVLNDPNNKKIIQAWLSNPKSKSTLVLPYQGTEIIGRGVHKGSTTVEHMSNAKIVLKKDEAGNFILTGYPTK